MVVELWRKHCTLKKLSVKHESPFIFVVSQWQRQYKVDLWYLLARLSLAAIFLVTWILSLVNINWKTGSCYFNPKWFIYLTNWGYTVCTLQSLASAAMIASCALKKSAGKLSKFAGNLYKAYWIINVVATDIAFGITILYWTLIYDDKIMPLDATNILMHGTNSAIMLIDLFLVAHPVRLLHCYLPVLFGLCYLIFSVIFYLAGGTSRENSRSIYPILDWTKPGTTTVICLGVLIFLVVLHCVTYGLFRLRAYIHSRTTKRTSDLGRTTSEANNGLSNPDDSFKSDVV